MTKHVALVCRLSPRPDGSYEGVDLQEGWGREYAAKAWPGVPIEVFADRGISATNGDNRPEFERFREWVADGKIQHVWAVEQSRLERREVEWFQLAAELDLAGITELHTNRDGIVRVRDEVAGIKAVLNAGEVRKLKKRVNDRLAENAANGLPPGSRPYGYVHGLDAAGNKTYLVVQEQAEVIRHAADMVLSGWSNAAVAAELTKRGLHGAHRVKVKDGSGETRPSTITGSTVKAMLTNPSVAGHRVHQGRVVGTGNWQPILSVDVWEACKAKLEAPRRVKRSDGGSYPIGAAHTGNPTGRRYLTTSGLAVCEVCEAPMIGTLKQLRNAKGVRSKPYLLCHPKAGGKGCVGIMLEETERYVVECLFDELDKPEFLASVAADNHSARRDEITAALAGVERKRNELAQMWASDVLTSAEWQAAKVVQGERETALRAELAAVPPPVVNVDLVGARAGWPGFTLDEQRKFLRMFIERVTIRKAVPGTKGFDRGRVSVELRKR